MADEIENKGTQDASTDLQKVAGVRSDHRVMMIDPVTRRFVYAEPDQLPVGEGGAPVQVAQAYTNALLTNYRVSEGYRIDVLNKYTGRGQYIYEAINKFDGTRITEADVDNLDVFQFDDGKFGLLFLPKNAVDTRDYGAKIDGNTDDSFAVQRAIDATLKRKGGEVYFASSTKGCLIDNPIYVNTNEQVPISLVGATNNQRDSEDGSTNYGSTIVVKRPLTVFNVNLKADGSSFIAINDQYVGFSAKNISFSGKNSVRNIIGFKMFRTRSKMENITGNRVDYVIDQPPTDVNGASNYCDMSIYIALRCVQSRYSGFRFSYNDSSVVDGIYMENPNSTCKFAIERFACSGMVINGLLLGISLNHATVPGGAFVRDQSCNSCVTNGIHIESSKFETMFDLFYCIAPSIKGLHTRFFHNNAFKFTNCRNPKIELWDGFANLNPGYFDIQILGTETENANIIFEGCELTNYPSRAVRQPVVGTNVMGGLIANPFKTQFIGPIAAAGGEGFYEKAAPKLTASGNNDWLASYISLPYFNDGLYSNIIHAAFLARLSPFVYRGASMPSGNAFEIRNDAGALLGRISGGANAVLNRYFGATGNTCWDMSTDETKYLLSGVSRMRLLANGRIVLGSATDDTGSAIQLGGSVSFIPAIKAVNHVLASLDYAVYFDAYLSPLVADLPFASTCKGRVYAVKKVDPSSNPVTIQCFGSETIDGANKILLKSVNASVYIQSDGISFKVIGSHKFNVSTKDVTTVAYTRTTINAAYPNAKEDDVIIQDGAGMTYIKKDDSPTGNWSVRTSNQLS
jgi:hypothetical protein